MLKLKLKLYLFDIVLTESPALLDIFLLKNLSI
jgi:hypothetical protein